MGELEVLSLLASLSHDIMNVPLNIVQTTYNNRSGSVTTEMLESKYQSGERFDSRVVREFLNSSAHQEIEFHNNTQVVGKQYGT